MSYHIYHTEGFILRGSNVGEDSRLLRIFTSDLGVIFAKAQGARKISSKNRAHVQDLSLGRFSFVRGKGGWRLVGAEKSADIQNGSSVNENMRTIAKISQLITRLSPGEEANKKFFDDFKNALLFLYREDLAENERKSFETIMAMKILSHLGYWSDEDEPGPFYKQDLTKKILREIFEDRQSLNLRIYEALETSHL